MAYIGNVPAEKYTALTQQTFSSPTGTSFTLSQAVTNSVDIDLYIDNVKQNPASYSVSGTALTTSTISSPSTMYCIFNGRTTETVNPPDDSVGLSQIASGTDGNLITFDASGNPAYVATGNDGQVLTSAGAGQPCAFEDASGGAWAVKASGTFSSTSELVVTSVTKTLKAYLSFVPSAATSINMLTSTDGGSGWGGVPYYDVVMILGGSSTNTNDKTNNSGLFQLNAGMTQTNISASGNNVIVELTLHNPESNRAKIATWDICYPTTVAQDDNLIYTGIGKGTWNSTTAINAIKFYPGSGTFSAGTYTILELN